MHLSKSQYTRGLQCHKSLWLYQHKREVISEHDPSTLSRFETGHRVGELAQSLFPGGIEVEYGDYDAMVSQTRDLIDRGEQVIYEATFVHQGVLIRADILVRNGEAWDFYEVKSSTRVKPYHEHDAAIQWFVVSRHLPLGKAHIVHIDTGYVLLGDLDLGQLFNTVDITETVLERQPGIETNLSAMAEMLAGGEPDIPIGPQCTNPYECDFKAYCWKDVPSPSVFNLHRLPGARKFELFHQGLACYEDVRNLQLNPIQALQIETALDGTTQVDVDRLREFIDGATYPINFLDFEFFTEAIPRYQGQKPYSTAIPFQYSLHILHADGQLEHKEFLADERSDPRPELARRLIEDITTTGSIVAYSQATEKSIINRLAGEFAEYEDALHALNGRFIDLITPFRKLWYYHGDFHGSFSIKAVLPAMFPDDESLSYKGLEIQEGEMASSIYARLDQVEDEQKREAIRESLLAYCKLDTLAMVMIWQKLNNLVG